MRICSVLFVAGCLALASFASSARAVDLTEIARFNINATGNPTVAPGDPLPPPDADFIGVNAVALAWKGGKLYIAGFNNSGFAPPSPNAETSIIEITNATATGLVTPTFSAKFGTQVTPASRGYTGLALTADGSRLAASFSDGFANASPQGPAPEGLQLFNTTTNTQLWAYAERGDGGVDFDPGFPGGNPAQGAGVAYVESFGSGRRALLDATTGTDIWTPANGMIWIPNGGSAGNTRDIAFDPETGDMYIRSNNDVYFADRSGDNATTQANNAKIVDLTDAPFVNYQHIAFLSNTSDGDLVMFNDRTAGGTGQDFFTVNKLINPAGVAQTLNFSFLPNPDSSPFTPNTGAGWYDYDFDPATQTLALLDPSNQNVHIFQVGNDVGVPGDFNGDGIVDGKDFLAWQRGQSPSPLSAGDLAEWQSAYVGSPLAAVASVPEPGSIVLLVLSLAGLCRRSVKA